jgi:hypothetical protein
MRLATADASTRETDRPARRAALRVHAGPRPDPCELRDHGEIYGVGVEVQFMRHDFPVYCRTFNPRLDPTRTPRQLAIQWAEAGRAAMENDG